MSASVRALAVDQHSETAYVQNPDPVVETLLQTGMFWMANITQHGDLVPKFPVGVRVDGQQEHHASQLDVEIKRLKVWFIRDKNIMLKVMG